MSQQSNKLLIGIAIGFLTSIVGGVALEYLKHAINKRRALHGAEPLGSFEEGYWSYDPQTKRSYWIPA